MKKKIYIHHIAHSLITTTLLGTLYITSVSRIAAAVTQARK